MTTFIAITIAVIISVFLMRLIGAWMLRINEVINELKSLNGEVKALRYQMYQYNEQRQNEYLNN